MFNKLSLLALTAPLVSGLVLQIPEMPTSGGQVTIKWTNEQGDPSTWSFELINTAFNNAFAIANNVDPSLNSITITLPVVPVGGGYTLEAVSIGNINDVFATTGSFSIGAQPSTTSTTATSTTSGTTSRTSGTSTSTTTTGSKASTTTTASVPSFTTSLVTTSATSAATSTTPAGTTGANGAATTPFSAALSSRLTGSTGGIAAVLLSAAAGVMMIAL